MADVTRDSAAKLVMKRYLRIFIGFVVPSSSYGELAYRVEHLDCIQTCSKIFSGQSNERSMTLFVKQPRWLCICRTSRLSV
jgi:hypothetical protein